MAIVKAKPTVFISYSHKDEVWKDRLMSHLGILSEKEQLTFWDDRQIGAGDNWYDKIEMAMNAASIAILLVSANSLTSKFILRDEVSRLLKRRDKDGLQIFPIIVKPCAWQTVRWLSQMQVRPTDGKPLSSYVGSKRDEALARIAMELYDKFKRAPKPTAIQKAEPPEKNIQVVAADVLDYAADVLVLKYAQGFYGVDGVVGKRLKGRSQNYPEISPKPGKFVLLPSKGQVAASHVLFVGVPDLYDFGYVQIRDFAVRAMKILSEELPDAKNVAMTTHGVGYGLDEREAFLALVGGLVDAFKTGNVPEALEKVTIVQVEEKRAARLQGILKENLPAESPAPTARASRSAATNPVMEAGLRSHSKPHVFVAMPFGDDMEDVYIFGIQGPANAAGYLCERVDMSVFTGDILTRIKTRIETAALVIADVTGANANVYLEIGYAWGKDRPTLLLIKKGNDPQFDVAGQRCIIYKSISELAKTLAVDLDDLRPKRKRA